MWLRQVFWLTQAAHTFPGYFAQWLSRKIARRAELSVRTPATQPAYADTAYGSGEYSNGIARDSHPVPF